MSGSVRAPCSAACAPGSDQAVGRGAGEGAPHAGPSAYAPCRQSSPRQAHAHLDTRPCADTVTGCRGRSVTLALIRRRFRGAERVTSIDARVGWRPMPADGMPIVGFTPDAPDLYLAVMHAGVVMAPIVGRLATGEIVAGDEAEALAPCRLSRFG